MTLDEKVCDLKISQNRTPQQGYFWQQNQKPTFFLSGGCKQKVNEPFFFKTENI